MIGSSRSWTLKSELYEMLKWVKQQVINPAWMYYESSFYIEFCLQYFSSLSAEQMTRLFSILYCMIIW